MSKTGYSKNGKKLGRPPQKKKKVNTYQKPGYSKNGKKLGRPPKNKSEKLLPKLKLQENEKPILENVDVFDIHLDGTAFDSKNFQGCPKMRVNKANLLTNLIHTKGNITKACANIGLDRSMHLYYLNNDEYYKQVFETMWEIVLDTLEEKAVDLAFHGDKQLLMFLLKTKGKDRGYTEKIEQEIDQRSAPIQINIIKPNDD